MILIMAQRLSIKLLIFLLVIGTFSAFSFSVLAQDAAVPEVQEAPAPAEEVPNPDAEKPLAPVLKTAANAEFNKALFFDQLDAGIKLSPMALEYEVAQDGKSLKIGNTSFSSKNFFFTLLPLGKSHAQISQILGNPEAQDLVLIMNWPRTLISGGLLEIITSTEQILWSREITEVDQQKWKSRLDRWRAELLEKGVAAKDMDRSVLFNSQFGILEVTAKEIPLWNQSESFRFCLTQKNDEGSTRLCTQKYGTRSSRDGSQIVLGRVKVAPIAPQILIQKAAAPLKQALQVEVDTPIEFSTVLAAGDSYEFLAKPQKLQLMDIADTKKPELLRVVGADVRPIGKSTILNPDQYGAVTRALGFEATIGDQRKFWMTVIRRDDPKLYVPGRGGGVFRQGFKLEDVPRAQSRIYLSRNTPTGTYKDEIQLAGRKQPRALVNSSQNSIEIDTEDPSLFYWNFRVAERGKLNRSYITVDDDAAKSYRSYFEIYKGLPREISGRLVAVQSGSDFVVLAEMAYNQWFEGLFGSTNYYLSRQRWGLSFKYFQSITQLKVSAAGSKADLTVGTLDLKYRLAPGLWGRDETVGLLTSYQNVTFGDLKAPMLGGGLFWARSMPRLFDDLFNLLPFMRYPKWVDMEFIYYAVPMDSSVSLNAPLSLNFHGKVLWTERIFGEAGFGIKRYGFQDPRLNQKAELNTFYSTVGLGINF